MTAGHRARKRFGQHFLVDPAVVGQIIDAVSPAAGDTLVEIGPGQAVLTDPLHASGAALHVIEIDRDLAADLRQRYRDSDSLTVHETDVLKFDFSELGDNLRIVGNLPYNISTPLLFRLLDFRARLGDIHVMLQKEVVDRIAAAPGGKQYGRLTVMLGCYFRPEWLFDVPPDAFSPPPRVHSAVVRLDPRPAGDPDLRDPALLARLVAAGFGKRRKTLRNSLAEIADADTLEHCGVDPSRRAETVPIDHWVRLANHLATRN